MATDALNLQVLRAVVQAYRSRAAMAIEVSQGPARRLLFADAGQLTGAGSNLPEDRLGQLLVAEGRLDPALLDPLEQAARADRRLFGNQLLQDGLLRPDELAAALERQAVLRFERALTMPGPVVTEARPAPTAALHAPLAALVLDFFRKAEVPVVESVASRIPWDAVKLAVHPDDLGELKLKPPELRVARAIAGGRAYELQPVEPGGVPQRAVAGLGALGLLAFGR